MLHYLKGTVEYKQVDYIVLETGGIGYKIYAPYPVIQSVGPPGSQARLYTHLYVREDMLSLYGFLTREELSLFEMLINVSGVGPKAALSILSSVPPSRFGLAVITGDVKELTKAQGVGVKTAQRIILELKDKLKKEQAFSEGILEEEKGRAHMEADRAAEAISALIVLGYTPVEANRAVAAVYSHEMDLETVIKRALKELVRG